MGDDLVPAAVQVVADAVGDPPDVQERDGRGGGGHAVTPVENRPWPSRVGGIAHELEPGWIVDAPAPATTSSPATSANSSVAARTRTTSSPRSPGVSGWVPVRMHSMKCWSCSMSGSWKGMYGDTMSPVR